MTEIEILETGRCTLQGTAEDIRQAQQRRAGLARPKMAPAPEAPDDAPVRPPEHQRTAP